MGRDRRADALLAALDTLPPRLREAFVLADLHGMSAADGARELFFNNLRVEGVPEPATAGLLATALLAFAVNRRR